MVTITPGSITFLFAIYMQMDVHGIVVYAWDAPFLSVQPDGHAPLLCDILKFWIPRDTPHSTQRITLQQRQRGRNAYMLDDTDWQYFMQYSCTELERCLQALPSECPADNTIQSLHDTATACFNHCFPTKPIMNPQHADILPWITCKWTHRHKCCETLALPFRERFALNSLLRLWHHWTRFRVMTRNSRKHAVQVRQKRFEHVLAEAQRAADAHNTYQLFQLINKFSPKQSKRKIQIQNPQGHLASPVEELAILKHFVSTTWHGSDFAAPSINPDAGLPFNVTDVQTALSQIPILKAVAAPFCPGMVWKAHSQLLAPWVFQWLLEWWTQPIPIIPPLWRHGWLTLIPKPGKTPNHPSQLRPLALQEPIGKSLIGMLGKLGLHQTLPIMQTWPLWAYLPFRSTMDALSRVSQHCRLARSLIASQRLTPTKRANGHTRFQTCWQHSAFCGSQ